MGDESLLLALLKWAWTPIVGVFAWIGKNMHSDIKTLKEKDKDCKLELSEFKLHVSENHPTKSDLNAARMETKESVDRVHGRLDDVATDVKTILRTMK